MTTTPTAEQQARDLLERMEVPNAQNYSSGELVELANLIVAAQPVQPALQMLQLNWSEERQPCEDIRYNHVTAESGLGRITIEWKGWKTHDTRVIYINKDYVDCSDTLGGAKKIAAKHLHDVAMSLIDGLVSTSQPVQPAPPAA